MSIEQVRRLRIEAGKIGTKVESRLSGDVLGIPEREFTPCVRRAVWALLREARSLRDAADRDHLLQILNRRAFLRELEREIASVARYGMPSTLVYLDLDGLKSINDCHGHPCGDAMLKYFAQFLGAHVRASDIVGRLGGDEFGLVLSHTNIVQAEQKCAQLASLLAAEPASWDGASLELSFSFGLVEISAAMTGESAVAEADAAMYRRRRLTR